jgi:hypothetical protein
VVAELVVYDGEEFGVDCELRGDVELAFKGACCGHRWTSGVVIIR